MDPFKYIKGDLQMNKLWKYLTAEWRSSRIARRILAKYKDRIIQYNHRDGEKYAIDLQQHVSYDPITGKINRKIFYFCTGLRLFRQTVCPFHFYDLHGNPLDLKKVTAT
jgi:hypothetical protein